MMFGVVEHTLIGTRAIMYSMLEMMQFMQLKVYEVYTYLYIC